MRKETLEKIIREQVRLHHRSKKILEEHRRLVAQKLDFDSLVTSYILEEYTGRPVDPHLLEEGLWDWSKHMVAKLGSLEKGGKILGRKAAYEAAKERLQKTLDTASNKAIKDLKASIESSYKGFPNIKSQEDFVNALIDIGETYDSIAAAVKSGDRDATSANAIVSSLRDLIIHYLDYELADVYKHFKEGKELNEEEEEVKGKFTKRGAGEEDHAASSTTMKGLESNLLPAVLVASGVLGGILAKSQWFVETIKAAPANPAQAITKVKEVLGPLDGEGFTQMLGRLTQGNPAHFSESMSPKGFFSAMQQVGIDPQNPEALFQLGVDPAAYQQALQSGAPSIGEMFPASNEALFLNKGASVVTSIVKTIAKKTAGGAAGGAAGAAMAANPVLAMIAAPVVAGALVKLIRVKGLKSSRAALLKDLANEMPNFPVPEEEVNPEEPAEAAPGGEEEEAAPPEEAAPEAEEGKPNAYNIYTDRGGKEPLSAILTNLEIPSGYKRIVMSDIKDQLEAMEQYIFEAEEVAADAIELQTADLVSKLKEAGANERVIQQILGGIQTWIGGQENIKVVMPSAAEEAPEEKEEETPDVEELPPAPETPPEQVKRLGLVRMDDSPKGATVFLATRKTKDAREDERDIMQKAQDNAVTGGGSNPTSSELDTAFKALTKKPSPEKLGHAEIEKLVKGKSKKEPEPYITVDSSIRKDVAKALKKVGATRRAAVTNKIKGAVDAVTKGLLNQLIKQEKKQTPRQAAIRIKRALTKAGMEDLSFDDLKELVSVFQEYGLVRPGELTPSRRRKKKAEAPAPEAEKKEKAPEKSAKRKELEASLASMQAAKKEAGLEERLGSLEDVSNKSHLRLFESLTKHFTK